MTAIIGVLNKYGMSMAADSAATVNGVNQQKIYNTANKIFNLSKYDPIGIMIYNSASFMTTPWEIIIKLYRSELSNKSFKTVKDYKNDFIEFLRSRNFFTAKDVQTSNFESFVFLYLMEIVNELKQNLTDDFTDREFDKKLLKQLDILTKSFKDENIIMNDFKDYDIKDFIKYAADPIKNAVANLFEKTDIKLSKKIIDTIIEMFYQYFISPSFNGMDSGLVFGGYGESEIYPSLASVRIGEVFDNRLRYYDDYSNEITDSNPGIIAPYAQTDVINMFIKGIDPNIEESFLSVLEDSFINYSDQVAKLIEKDNPDLAKRLENLDLEAMRSIHEEKLHQFMYFGQIKPTIETISILSIEDLAEMAESLIYLTYLKKRMSSDEESVGGPIDVAMISKGDGFIWKKRKQNFDHDLNRQVFINRFLK